MEIDNNINTSQIWRRSLFNTPTDTTIGSKLLIQNILSQAKKKCFDIFAALENELNCQTNDNTTKVVRYKHLLETKNSQIDQLKKNFGHEINQLKEEKDAIESNNACKLVQEKDRTDKIIEGLKLERDKMKTKFANSLQAEKEKLEENFGQMNLLKAGNRQLEENSNIKIKELTEEVTLLKTSLLAATKSSDGKSSNNGNNGNKSSKCQKDKDKQLQKELASSKVKIKDLTNSKKRQEKLLATLQSESSEKEKKMRIFERQNANLQFEVDKLKEELKNSINRAKLEMAKENEEKLTSMKKQLDREKFEEVKKLADMRINKSKDIIKHRELKKQNWELLVGKEKSGQEDVAVVLEKMQKKEYQAVRQAEIVRVRQLELSKIKDLIDRGEHRTVDEEWRDESLSLID